MKVKLLIAMFMLGMSTAFVHAEVVPGFYFSGNVRFSNAARTDIYENKGYGGNQFFGSVQNRTEIEVNFRPFMYADNKSSPFVEYRILPCDTQYFSYEFEKDIRKDPYNWMISFEFLWGEYANFITREVWMNYHAVDWNSEDYKE